MGNRNVSLSFSPLPILSILYPVILNKSLLILKEELTFKEELSSNLKIFLKKMEKEKKSFKFIQQG
jgi:hypothetical protein